MRIIFLVSGNGGNLKFIDACIKNGFIKDIDLVVIGDRNCGAIRYAINNSIQHYIIPYSRENNLELMKLLNNLEPDCIITNWNKILDEEIVAQYRGKLINVHYSILPAFGGMIGIKPVLEALKKQCKFIGATIHLVNEKVDDGEILGQGICRNNKSESEIINNVFQMGCFLLLNSILIKNNIELNYTSNNKTDINNWLFEPQLRFCTEIFNNTFWKDLREKE